MANLFAPTQAGVVGLVCLDLEGDSRVMAAGKGKALAAAAPISTQRRIDRPGTSGAIAGDAVWVRPQGLRGRN